MHLTQSVLSRSLVSYPYINVTDHITVDTVWAVIHEVFLYQFLTDNDYWYIFAEYNMILNGLKFCKMLQHSESKLESEVTSTNRD